jgi:hypothetical protein
LTDEKVTIIILGNKFTRGVYTAATHAYDIFGSYHQQQSSDDEDNDEADTKPAARPKPKKSPKKKR